MKNDSTSKGRPRPGEAATGVGRVVLAATLVWLMSAAPAAAIVGGQDDGDAHPYVGTIDARPLGGENPYATGVLISPTVFLTVAHLSTVYDRMGVTEARVTFESDATSATSWHTGTIHTNPAYAPKGPGQDAGDLAVIVFDEPVVGIVPASLPSPGLLDDLRPGNRPQFDVVGSGCRAYEPPPNNGGRAGPDADFSTSGMRQLASATFVTAGEGTLLAHMDAGARVCRGDSGGPALFAGSNVLAGITIGGAGMLFDQRVDTVAARTFLGQYVTLP